MAKLDSNKIEILEVSEKRIKKFGRIGFRFNFYWIELQFKNWSWKLIPRFDLQDKYLQLHKSWQLRKNTLYLYLPYSKSNNKCHPDVVNYDEVCLDCHDSDSINAIYEVIFTSNLNK